MEILKVQCNSLLSARDVENCSRIGAIVLGYDPEWTLSAPPISPLDPFIAFLLSLET